jgi:hypothetical protein
MTDPLSQSRMSPADRWAEQQMRDRLLLETAAVVAWQTYEYETTDYRGRRAMRWGWALVPTYVLLGALWHMVTDPGDPTNWTGWSLVLTALDGLLVARLLFGKPAARTNDFGPVGEPQRYPDDMPFDNEWRQFYPNQ